ncbi:hypothetical protein Bbelb_030240 [Branchiostoma belcheri]|nr:hypothetical protein Bbelb_030240 [Branchiostoma belcheri]
MLASQETSSCFQTLESRAAASKFPQISGLGFGDFAITTHAFTWSLSGGSNAKASPSGFKYHWFRKPIRERRKGGYFILAVLSSPLGRSASTWQKQRLLAEKDDGCPVTDAYVHAMTDQSPKFLLCHSLGTIRIFAPQRSKNFSECPRSENPDGSQSSTVRQVDKAQEATRGACVIPAEVVARVAAVRTVGPGGRLNPVFNTQSDPVFRLFRGPRGSATRSRNRPGETDIKIIPEFILPRLSGVRSPEEVILLPTTCVHLPRHISSQGRVNPSQRRFPPPATAGEDGDTPRNLSYANEKDEQFPEDLALRNLRRLR